MRRENLLSPEQTWVIMKVGGGGGLVPRSRQREGNGGRSRCQDPGRDGRGGALGITLWSYILLLHFSQNVSVRFHSSSRRVLWFQCPRLRQPWKSVKSSRPLRPAARVRLLSGAAPCASSSSPGAGSGALASIKPFSVTSSGVLSLAPEFLRILRPSTPASFATSICSVISLIGSVLNPVRSCTASGQFSPAGIPCFRCGSSHGSSYNNDTSLVA